MDLSGAMSRCMSSQGCEVWVSFRCLAFLSFQSYHQGCRPFWPKQLLSRPSRRCVRIWPRWSNGWLVLKTMQTVRPMITKTLRSVTMSDYSLLLMVGMVMNGSNKLIHGYFTVYHDLLLIVWLMFTWFAIRVRSLSLTCSGRYGPAVFAETMCQRQGGCRSLHGQQPPLRQIEHFGWCACWFSAVPKGPGSSKRVARPNLHSSSS